MNPEKYQYFEELFNPQSIAIVGASEQNDFFIVPLLKFNFPGKLYLVNPNRDELFGLKCYPSIMDINDTIDYVICAIPARFALDLMKQCIEKGVKTVHYFTSGFSETGNPENVKLEEELVRIARAGRVRIIGPNCMGLYVPESRISFNLDFPRESGSVSLVSQSGALSVGIVLSGRISGVGFSKVISFGNAIDLDAPDYIEYLAEDPKTKVITAYLEGIKDGRKLFHVLKEANLRKPIIVMKGGRTSDGARAASSHTGALSGSKNIWNAMFKQLGIVNVKTVEELTDTMLAFTHDPKPRGKRVLIISYSGGSSVIQADVCKELGLEIPVISRESRDKIMQLFPPVGIGIKNPIDITPAYFGVDGLTNVISTAASEEIIDIVIFETAARLRSFFERRNNISVYNVVVDRMVNSGNYVRDVLGKPFLVALPPSIFEDEFIRLRDLFQREGFPVFPSVDRAARAISHVINYHDFLKEKRVT